MMTKQATLVLSCWILLQPAFTFGAVEVDLRMTPPDLTLWGAHGPVSSSLGARVGIGDFNGDGENDIVFGRTSSSALDGGPRFCIEFGPFTLPLEIDYAVRVPATCVVGPNPGGGWTLGSTPIADLDGDGIVDLVAHGWASNGGVVAVFRGRPVWPPVLDLRLDADWYFAGADNGDWLINAAIGDLNGDGIADLALFAAQADGPAETRPGSGEGYIFFGPAASWRRTYDLTTDSPDVHILGADAGDGWGIRNNVIIADLLGDSTPDLIVGAEYAGGAGNAYIDAGEVAVLRGRSIWPAVIDLRDPVDFRVYGPATNTALSVPVVADLDGDGVNDLAVGGNAFTAMSPTRRYAGAVFVFGGGALSGEWDLAVVPANGVVVGRRADSLFGQTLWAADVDGDGFLELVIGAPVDATPFGRPGAGSVFVVQSCPGALPSMDLWVNPAAMSVYGIDAGDTLGMNLAVGDIDGDGRADLFAGAREGASLGNLRPDAGEAHLVLGRSWRIPACNISPDPGPGAIACSGTDVTLNGSATVVTGCSIAPQYRWLEGLIVVRDWSPDPTAIVRPTATTTYRLEVRCGECAGPCFASSSVGVTVEPDVIPPDLGNSLHAVRRGGDVDMLWGTVVEARSYSVFRGILKDTWPPAPHIESLVGAAVVLPDVTSPPNDPLYFYRASGASCSGVEGP